MKNQLLAILLILTPLVVLAQEEEKKENFGIKFSGFVKNDVFFDSRQTVAAREGHFLLWPAAESLDVNGDDINAKSNLNILALQSRLSGAITGPDAFGAKTSGVIEGDFFAQANDNINLFRLRHAYIKLSWPKTTLITGQTWNPLFVTGCFPGTVSFNTGTPLQSFARNPQVRINHKIGNLEISGAMLAQRDYTSRAAGITSDYLRNAVIPDIHVQVQYSQKNTETGTSFLGGVGVAYKTIVPRLFSEMEVSPVIMTVDSTNTVNVTKAVTAKYKVDEKVSGLTAIAFTKITTKAVTMKLQGRYGENIADVLSISGFAVKAMEDATTGEMSYTPLKNATVWGEVHTNGAKMQVGVFGGYLKNMGTKEAMSSASNKVYGLGTNIESLLRISPRVIFISNKFKLATEIEYTGATYGSGYDVNYVPASTTSVSNVRVLVSTIYSF